MLERHDLRRGSCPGAHTPMESGDGWIVRVRAGARALSSDALRTIAETARSHGNGLVEITRRANLQLRGLRDAGIAPARARLVAAGLVDALAEREQRLSLLVSPWSECEPALEALAREVERALTALPSSLRLDAKFGVVIEDARASLGDDVEADIRLALHGASCHVLVGGTRTSARLLGGVPVTRAGEVVARLVDLLARSGLRRMRELADVHACRAVCAPLEDARPSEYAAAPLHVGLVEGLGVCVGIPFGTAEAATWNALADLADGYAGGRVRTTVSRSLLFPAVPVDRREAFSREVAALGAFVTPDDARARLVACPGAPACSAAFGETRALALSLSAHLPRSARLHVSGCPKSCAQGASCEVTLVHGPDGVHLGFDLDVARSAALSPLPLAELPARLSAHFEPSP